MIKTNKILDHLNHTIKSATDSEEIKLSLKQVSDVACASGRTTERLFQEILHSPFRKYFMRLRIEYAAHLLQNTQLSIVEIARKIGYTPSSFSKEFKIQFGCTAATFRKQKRSIQTTTTTLHFEIINHPALHLAYVSHIGNYDTLNTTESEHVLFDRITELCASENIIRYPTQYYGIAFDDNNIRPNDDCRFYACVEVHEPIKTKEIKVPSFNTITIPQGKYAKFTHIGPYKQLNSLYEEIFHNILLNPEIRFRLNTSAYILEHYLNDIQNTPKEKLITEILFPIT